MAFRALKRTEPAEQSLAISANLLKRFSTIKSTTDSIAVFNNSKIIYTRSKKIIQILILRK